MTIGPGASLTYTEGHYHGPHGGMQVLPHATIKIGKGARYFSDFSLLSGSVGNLDIDYRVEVEEEGIAELSAKIFAHKTDHIALKEAVILRGEQSRGLIKTRVVLEHLFVAQAAEEFQFTELFGLESAGGLKLGAEREKVRWQHCF